MRKFTDRTEILNIRMSPKEKQQIKELVKNGILGDSSSEVVRNLLKRAYIGR
jgi:Arc/MetJ-type ribon-helix-helix transcriptional regulator